MITTPYIPRWTLTAAALAALTTTALACGDGIAERTEGALEVSAGGSGDAKFVTFPSTAPGFTNTGMPAIVIKNGGAGDLKVTSVEFEGDSTEYLTAKGELPTEFTLTPEQEQRFQFELAIPRPAENDAPLTCPDPPGDFPTALADGGGRYCGRLIIRSNARDDATDVVYFLVDQAEGSISVDPTVLNFTAPQVGQTQRLELNITNTSTSGNLTLERINKVDFTEGTSSDFQIDGFDQFPLDIVPGDTITYNIIYNPTVTGEVTGTLEVKSNDPAARTTNVLIRTGTSTTPRIAVSPDTLTFPEAAPGSPQSLSINVTNEGMGAALNIAQMVVLPTEAQDAYTIMWDDDEDGTFEEWVAGDFDSIPRQNTTAYEIVYEPTEAGVSIPGTLRISSNADNVPNGEVSVTLSGSAAAPDGSISPTTIIFNTPPGESETRSFSIANGGLAPLEITGVSLNNLDPDEFFLDPDPADGFSVASGGVMAFDVVYNRDANDVGMDIGDIAVQTNNPFSDGELVVSVRNNNDENAISPSAAITQTPDGNVSVGTEVTLDGTGSTTETGEIAYHIWTILDAPDGSSASISDDTSATATFTPDVVGNYRVQLVVGNNRNPPLEGSATRNITVVE